MQFLSVEDGDRDVGWCFVFSLWVRAILCKTRETFLWLAWRPEGTRGPQLIACVARVVSCPLLSGKPLITSCLILQKKHFCVSCFNHRTCLCAKKICQRESQWNQPRLQTKRPLRRTGLSRLALVYECIALCILSEPELSSLAVKGLTTLALTIHTAMARFVQFAPFLCCGWTELHIFLYIFPGPVFIFFIFFCGGGAQNFICPLIQAWRGIQITSIRGG